MAEHGWERRDFLRATGLGALGLGAAPLLLGACSSTDPEKERKGGGTLKKIKDQGHINVGIAGEQPYGYVDKSGKITGEAPELAKVIFGELGVKEVRPVQVDFGGLIGGLQAGRFDTIAAGMSILPKRCAKAAFANPDYKTETAFLVKKGNPKGIKRFKDVAKDSGLKLGVMTGAVEKDFATKLGVKKDQIKVFPDQASGFDGLKAGRVDAVALTGFSLRSLLSKHEGAPFEVTDQFAPVIDGKPQVSAGGFAFRKSDADLLKAYNGKLEELKKSGKLLEILKPFGFTKEELPGDLTAAQLCKG